MAGDRQRCLQSDMDGYVSKPINAKDLFVAINEATQAPGPRPQASSLDDARDATSASRGAGLGQAQGRLAS
jgi:hypothetical protein